MRELSQLGIKPYSRREPAFRPPTNREVAEFEGVFDARLPEAYIGFLRQFNGGRHPEISAFTTASGYTTVIDRFHYLLPEKPGAASQGGGWEYGNLWAETRQLRAAVRQNGELSGLEDVRDQLTDRVVPFAIDNGGASQFVFDLRQSPAPVCLAVASRGFSLVALADSFAEFIDGLQAFVEE
jgi:hypothetical protein